MGNRLLNVKRFLTSYSARSCISVFTILALLIWGFWGWSSCPSYSNPFDSLPLFPAYIKFESRYHSPSELFLIMGKADDAIGEDIVVPCNPSDVLSPFQALYLVEMDDALMDWEYRLTLFYTPYIVHQYEDSMQEAAPPVTILISYNGLSIDGINYALPEGCSRQGIVDMTFSLYLSRLYLAQR